MAAGNPNGQNSPKSPGEPDAGFPSGHTMLTRAIAEGAVAAAQSQEDPDSVAAATALRRNYPPELAAVALEQASLRRRAKAKFGQSASKWFFTAHGLEQATRPEVARYRAGWLAERGVRRIVDLGCGIGVDSWAYRNVGLKVVAVESDPATAEVAQLNLGQPVLVIDATTKVELLAEPDTLAYCDPARRTSRGRSWDPAELSPPWQFVGKLLERGACVKLGPGFPRSLIPAGVEAQWISHRRQGVELTLYTGPGAHPDQRHATVLTDGQTHQFSVDDTSPRVSTRAPAAGGYLSEPDPAVLAAGGADTLAAHLGAQRVSAGIGYLLHANQVPAELTPLVLSFEVLEVLPYHRKTLKAWLRVHQVGRLDIKKRGIDLDPATLRRELKPRGANAATWIITPTVAGARVLVASLVPVRHDLP